MYEYFISYLYQGGFGHCAIDRDTAIDSGVEVKDLNDFIRKEKPECGGLIITNFILLSGPK